VRHHNSAKQVKNLESNVVSFLITLLEFLDFLEVNKYRITKICNLCQDQEIRGFGYIDILQSMRISSSKQTCLVPMAENLNFEGAFGRLGISDPRCGVYPT